MGKAARTAGFLVAGAMAAALHAPPAAAGVAEGNAALARFDYRAALSEFSEAAARGDSEGQYQLGLLYMLGHGGIVQDYGRAAQWFGRSAESGHPRAMYMLANLYAVGNGVPQNLEEARKLMLTAEPGLTDATRLSARASAVMTGQLLDARRQGSAAVTTPASAAPAAATARPAVQQRGTPQRQQRR